MIKTKSLKGKDNLWTTNYEIASILSNPEDGYNYSHGSDKKVSFKCKDCGYESVHKINKVVSRGFKCPLCGDNISLGEKLLYNVLVLFDKNIYREKIFSWSNNKRYDFYSEKFDIIIEVHGSQHYRNEFNRISKDARTLLEEINNDLYKENLAYKNGFSKERYIIIDASKSDISYIKENIMKSNLSNYIDLSKVNWNTIYNNVTTNNFKSIYEYFNSHNVSARKISEFLNIGYGRVSYCLKLATDLGLCNYDPNFFADKFSKKSFPNKYEHDIVSLKVNNPLFTIKDIADNLCINTDTVRKYLKKNNLYDAEFEKMCGNESKINKNIKYSIRVFDLNDNFIGEYRSARELSERSLKEFGIKFTISSINKACNKDSHKYNNHLFYRHEINTSDKKVA